MKSVDYKDLCLDMDAEVVRNGVGGNVIPAAKEKPLWKRFLEKFKDPIIVILLVVFFFSVGVSLYEVYANGKSMTTLIEPLGIFMALMLATGVGFVFEVKAERAFRILNQKKDERPVKVYRRDRKSGRVQLHLVKRSDVVVGDVVSLENGDEVPADGELVSAVSLMVDESAFTGEMYASKTTEESGNREEEAYPHNFLLRGSVVIEGHCFYRVTAVGMDTEEGKGSKLLQEDAEVRTPLNEQLDRLGGWITKASYIVASLIIVGRLIYYFWFDGNADNDSDVLEILTFSLNSVMLAVTLIVVAVPEGLPMSVTISLALSMKRMLKENNLVRKLHACETMGAATVICTDKTGTLTRNKLRVMEDSEERYADINTLARCIAVNSTAELTFTDDEKPKTLGNPTEGALLYWLYRRKEIDYRDIREEFTVVKQEPFSSEKKHMVTIATERSTGETFRFIKGAPEIVLGMSDEIASGKKREEVEQRLSELQTMGRRTLAFAMQQVEEGKNTPLVFIGCVGMTDPIREDVRDAIDTCHRAGVNVIMVTGDVALTAEKIARQTGIIGENESVEVLTGAEFAEISDERLKSEILPKLKVLSRARPADKARLVTLLQENGQVVAVTGDGTNDAPALKKAQVGLSMGDGTARAKEASDITIIDNSFASINTAILWGRSLYLNIRRFIVFQMTINVCACLIVLFGAFVGLESPLNVTQMLWVNLIMDTFAAMALSSLPPDHRVMLDKPRDPNSQIIDRKMARRILSVGLLFFLFLVCLWQLLWHVDLQSVKELSRGDYWQTCFEHFFDMGSSENLSTYELGVFFTFFVLLQFWNLFNARYFRTGRSLLQDLWDAVRNPKSLSKHYSTGFLLILVVILGGQILIVNVFGLLFGVSPLSFEDWMWLILYTCPILVVSDIVRAVRAA